MTDSNGYTTIAHLSFSSFRYAALPFARFENKLQVNIIAALIFLSSVLKNLFGLYKAVTLPFVCVFKKKKRILDGYIYRSHICAHFEAENLFYNPLTSDAFSHTYGFVARRTQALS